MILNEWMTGFYKKNWYSVNEKTAHNSASGCLFEWRIKSNQYKNIETAQKLGYALVETLVKFQTEINSFNPVPDNIRLGKPNDIEEILNILNVCIIENENFYNRFKNRDFFTESQSKDYYKQSVNNFFCDGSSNTMVAEDELGVYGFRIMKKDNENEYSGVMTGVLPRAKGKGTLGLLQNGMSSTIKTPYMENNATNLGNYAVIRNHIREKRRLSEIEHIFYKMN